MSERAATIRLNVPDLPLPTLAVDGATGAFEQQFQALVLNDRQTLVQSIQTDLDHQIEALVAKRIAQRRALEEALIEQRIVNEVAQRVQHILEQNRLARHRQFGPSSEAGQGCLFNEAEQLASEPEPDDETLQTPKAVGVTGVRAANGRPKNRGHRRALPPELPRVDRIIEVTEDQRLDANGVPMVRIGEEVSEALDIIPMQIRVIRTIRPKYAPANGQGAPVIAPVPATILPRTQFTAGFIAMLLVVKYADGLPLHRFAKVLDRHGVTVPRQTLARTVISTAQALQPLHNLMRDVLLESPVLHMDETKVQVLKEPGKSPTSHSYMWVQLGGLPGKPVVLFDYDPTRSGDVPIRLLEGWQGYLMTDDYGGYNAVAALPGVERLACAVHARRKFVEAKKASPHGKSPRADQAIEFFARLYRIEKRVRNAPDALRYRVRQKLSRQVLDELRAWLDEWRPKTAPKSKLGEALAYLDGIWSRLERFIERGDLPVDNNPIENSLRPFVVGRRSWLFASTPDGARASAVIYSLIETAKACGREPYAWLLYVLERLPLAKTVDDVEALLPWNVHDQDLAMNLVAQQ